MTPTRPLLKTAQSVLFACSENAVRSPMAESLLRLRAGRALHIASVGVRPGIRNPFVTAVMAELGIDLGRHTPQQFEDLDDTSFDLIITLSPEAHHRALEFTRTVACEVIYWPTFDPTITEGSRTNILASYRDVREALSKRIVSDVSWETGKS